MSDRLTAANAPVATEQQLFAQQAVALARKARTQAELNYATKAIAEALAAEREKAAKRCDEAGEEIEYASYEDAEDNWRAACAHCREMIRVMP